MDQKQSFEIIYDKKVKNHLVSIERKYHSLIRRTIENQLKYEPDTETRNRKPLFRASEFGESTWEIRFGPDNRFRVFYRSDLSAGDVRVLAVGVKVKDQLFIGGKRFEL
ncbi:MAG: addiction module toxin RelE [Deltaproteobacteria bacterium]|nr:MAG: addiction module toxin RelE [Deltaproteobacteria bacterium]